MQQLIKLDSGDGYVDKLVKLVPAEAISAYIALVNVAGVSGTTVNAETIAELQSATTIVNTGYNPEMWYAFGIALFILLVARVFGSMNVDGANINMTKVNWSMVGISLIAFVLWVYTIGGNTSGPFMNVYSLFWGTALIVLFTFLAPYFYDGAKKIRSASGKPAER